MKKIKKQTDGKWTQTNEKIDKITDKKKQKNVGTELLKRRRENKQKENKQLNTERIQQTSFKLPYSLTRKSAPLLKENSTYMKCKVLPRQPCCTGQSCPQSQVLYKLGPERLTWLGNSNLFTKDNIPG